MKPFAGCRSGGTGAGRRFVGMFARAVLLESILMGAQRAHPHALGVAPLSPAGRRRKRKITQIGTAIKPGRRRLTTVNNTIL